MKRLLMIAALIGCGGDDPDLHDVEACMGQAPDLGNELCERACSSIPSEVDPAASCQAFQVDGRLMACDEVRTVDGLQGCCFNDEDGVTRFAECQ